MKTYNFKETEIGKIPEDWEVNSLSQAINIIGGGTPKTSNPEYWGGEIPWISVVDFVGDSRWIRKTEKSITKKGLNESSTKLLHKGQLIISARGTVGEIGQITQDMAFNQSCYGLDGKDKIQNDFLYYLLKYRLSDIRSKTHGSVFNTITRATFDQLLVPIPPFQEQRTVAKILSDLDAKIELNHQMNVTLENIAETLFKHWFVDFEFPNEEGKPFKSSGGKMVDSEMGKIPEGWGIKPIDEVANFLNGLALQKYPVENGDEYLPVIKIRELKQGITDSSDKANIHVPKEYVVEDGDVLFSWSGSLEVAIWASGKGALNQPLFKVTSEKFPKWFYYFWVLRYLPEYRHIAEGKATTMGHIQRQHLKNSLVLVPDKSTLAKMDKLLTPIIEKLVSINVASRNLSKIRDSLLPKLMSGAIRVEVN
ncbi:restriction endonuclease subunit S [Candidatus Micrarchaeota archaeon]|nr:restriction endonuclease subunit S [Candidatus Micrarchaeota archaeon]